MSQGPLQYEVRRLAQSPFAYIVYLGREHLDTYSRAKFSTCAEKGSKEVRGFEEAARRYITSEQHHAQT